MNALRLFLSGLAVVGLFTSSALAAEELSLPPASVDRITVRDRSWPQEPGEAHVCLWKDDALAAFSLSIDDNHQPDHAYWTALGEETGWRWTWFVITGLVGTAPGWGSWDQWQALADAGHEVQAHGLTPMTAKEGGPSLEEEYSSPIQLIEEHVTGQRCRVMAYPNGFKTPPHDAQLAAEYYIACRGVRGLLNPAGRINYRDVNSVSNARGFTEPEAHWASFAGLLNPANRNKFRAWYSCHFHGLTPELKTKVADMMALLKAHEQDMWVAPFGAVALYAQERDTAVLKSNVVDDGSIRIELTDGMQDDVFDVPLTIKVCVDADWKNVQAQQQGQARAVQMRPHQGKTYVLVEAIPDQGVLTLSKI